MANKNRLIEQWSKAHTSFNEVENALAQNGKKSGVYGSFFEEALRESPNGDLYYHSAFLEDLAKGRKAYLGHVTFGLDEIAKSGSLYSSGGCLVGSAYCFPFTKTGEAEFRFHNLGEYIFREETAGRHAKPPEVMLFEVDLEGCSHNNLLGINYLKLGEIHYELFSELEYLLSGQEQFDLKKRVEKNILQALPFLKLCNEAWLGQTLIDPDLFYRSLNETVPRLPVLGYIYMEAIAEYLMLYADCSEARKFLGVKEAYNVPYKRLMYALYPEYKRNFRLNDFNPAIALASAYIAKEGYIRGHSGKRFGEYVMKKIVCLVNQLLVSDEGRTRIGANKVWAFEDMAGCFKPLVGHMIHRELRTFGRYPDFYFYYDQMKALQAWNYWNHMGVAVPFNGVFPKGEVGINPANQDLSFRAFRCETRAKDGFLFAEPAEELQVRLMPRLVDLKYTLMRNKPQ